MKGAVYSMVEFNGKLLASINSTVRPGPLGTYFRLPIIVCRMCLSQVVRCRVCVRFEGEQSSGCGG